ncbi:MAG: multicopper oxidase family protein [Bryobacteraceae bacterium]|jgi:FtsP/CotA-like multicopper oxidase with cupredoxin domain
MKTLNRRQVLSALAGVPWLSRIGLAEGRQPREIELTLTARKDWLRLGNSDAYLDTYNGALPGPVIETRPGDRLLIHFRNELPEPTNLHYHGLHVPPTGRADNPMLSVPAREQFDYQFEIPANHPAGTFWYHPHLHGLAAAQLSRGLAGLIIVRGELDEIPEIAAAEEQFLVLQDFGLDRNAVPIEPTVMDSMNGREGGLVTVNGRVNPNVTLQESGWARLRIVNASSSRFYRLAIEEHSLHVIATDGGALPAPIECSEVLMAPGERIDVMIEGSRPGGRYRMLNLPYQRTAGLRRAPQAEVLATVEYVGRASDARSLPAKLVSVETLPEASVLRSFTLGGGMGMGTMGGGGMAFTINGRTFDPRRVDTEVRLDTVEDWAFTNPTTMDHPMHIHTNPFQVIGANGMPTQAWKDVVIVPARSAVTVRTRFSDFTGRTMYHCHILDHEDLGMMATLQILASAGNA